MELHWKIYAALDLSFFTKNAITVTFDLREIERKTVHFVVMNLCCASNAAIKNVKGQSIFFQFF